MALSRVGLVGYDSVSNAQIAANTIIPEDMEDRSITSVKLAIPQSLPYSANVTGNASVTRSLAVGYTDGRVPQANLDVKGNTHITGNIVVNPDSNDVQTIGKAKISGLASDFMGFSHYDMHSAAQLAIGQSSAGLTDINSASGQIVSFRVANVEKMRMDASGNFGIGVSSPTALLDCGGDFALTKSAQAQVRVAGVIGGTGQTTTGTNSYQNTSPQFDFANAQNWRITLANNVTFGRPWNCKEGQTGSIFVGQDGTGSRTASFSNDWLFPAGTAPTLTTTASANDRIDYIVQKVQHGGQAVGVQAVVTLDLK
tara:strand:+ start:26 stop:961 length:936 start_codon:yes stop_codon:yes gene_type:complete